MSKSVKRFALTSRSKLRESITIHDFGSIRSKIIVIKGEARLEGEANPKGLFKRGLSHRESIAFQNFGSLRTKIA
ncbi:MAG TPA: hypothetical protein VME69_13935 [Methylocella sp.]|nr:hypothetical protein [Methylocella sp.]